MMVAPMRQELTSAGIEEARTAAEVENAISQKGTVMVVVNSICGCAAGRMRPAVRAAVQHNVRPEHMIQFLPDRTVRPLTAHGLISRDTRHLRLPSAFCKMDNWSTSCREAISNIASRSTLPRS